MRHIYKYILFIAMVAVLAACDIHEFPDDGGNDPAAIELTINLDFNTNMPLLSTVNVKSRSTDSDQQHDVRYIVNAYPMVKGKYLDSPAYHQIFTKEDITNLNTSVKMNLGAGKYLLRVWTDFVNHNSIEDRYYCADDFTNISLVGEHSGSNDFRDAFIGSQEIDLTNHAPELQDVASTTVEMERPLAKFIFIATDLREFAEMYYNTYLKGSQFPASNINQLDMSRLHTEIYYTGYMPCVFNMATNHPIDSKMGVHFSSSIVNLGDGEASLGFDYVLVNGKQSSITLALVLLDNDNNAISTITGINVPLSRSKLTEIRGKFLTEGGTSGMSIDPNFEGDYNITVN